MLSINNKEVHFVILDYVSSVSSVSLWNDNGLSTSRNLLLRSICLNVMHCNLADHVYQSIEHIVNKI